MSTNVELSGIEVLSAPQCRQLLAQGCVGRVGFVAGGRPHVLPVNYAADDSGVVVFRTGAGSLLMAVSRQDVAFEVDGLDVAHRSGWSVCVYGTASEITETGRSESRAPPLPRRDLVGAWPPGAVARHLAPGDHRAPAARAR